MNFDSWDDLRVALAVARSGTVSAAAQTLGIHHATVIRRIDSLEARLGVKLFQRHPRGYALTEPGRAMLKVAGEADERFAQLAAQITSGCDQIAGELIVTSLPELSDVVMPRLIRLMRQHPGLRVNYVTDVRLFRLDAGEAHVAIRAGSQPTEPDYVVRSMGTVRHPLYAAPDYVSTHGPVTDIAGHPLAVLGEQARNAPLMRWLLDRADPARIVLAASDESAREAVIRAGLAIGPLPPSRAEGLVEVMALPEWESRLWLVTHVDLHRSPKVQAAVTALRGD